MLPAIGGMILPLMGRKLDMRLDKTDCQRVFYRDCQRLEDHLQKHKYLVGETITLADLFVVGLIMFGVMVFHKVLYVKYPRLSEWFNEVYETPMFEEVAGPLHLLDVPIPGAE
jgi:elongation factor 1-gamma